MLNSRIIAAISLVLASSSFALPAAQAQSVGHRTNLQSHDLSIPGHEAVQVRVDLDPGATAPNHRHPGEEIIYVLEGTMEYRLQGRPTVTLKVGDALFVPAGVVHSATNIGTGEASELATYVVEKGKPLVELLK